MVGLCCMLLFVTKNLTFLMLTKAAFIKYSKTEIL